MSKQPRIGPAGVEIGWIDADRVQFLPWIADAPTIFRFVPESNDPPRASIEDRLENRRPGSVSLGDCFRLQVAWGDVMAYPRVITAPVLALYLVRRRAFIASIASTGGIG